MSFKIGLVGHAVPGLSMGGTRVSALDLWDLFPFHSFLITRHPEMGFGWIEDVSSDGRPVHTDACTKALAQFLPGLDALVVVGDKGPTNLVRRARELKAHVVYVGSTGSRWGRQAAIAATPTVPPARIWELAQPE